MGKITIGILAFAGGAVVGALAARAYFMRHGLALVGTSIADRIFGENSTASRITGGVLDTIQGIGA